MQTNETLTRARAYAAGLGAVRQAHVRSMSVQTTGDRLRNVAYGHVVSYLSDFSGTALALWRSDLDLGATRRGREARRAVFIVDSEGTVRAFYVAGHGPSSDPDMMFLHGFPSNDSVALNGARPVETGVWGAWRLGPRTAYHVLLSAVPELTDNHGHRINPV